MRRIVVASPAYLKARGEPKTPEAIASHQTIQFGATAASPEWRFVEDGREVRITCTPRFATNSADAAIQYAEQGGGLTRVLAYQAADAIKAGRLKIVLAKFELPPLPIHIVYPTSRLLSAKVRAFIDLVIEISDWHFGDDAVVPGRAKRVRTRNLEVPGVIAPRNDAILLRHHAKRPVGARDHGVVGLDQTLREADACCRS